MVRDNKRYMVSHTTNNNNTNNNLIMPTQWLTQPSFSRHISIPQEQREKLATSSSKRPRGKFPRSNNNPKSPVVIEKITESPMKMILIEIPVGKDIVGALINLAQRHQSCLTVLRGDGHVFGGIVGGRIKAASVVLITAILLRKPKFHRLVNIDGNVFEIEERVTPNSNNNNNNN
ncbi:AT hook motif DNA-binding family protein, partial [Trifolium medium]|nr:AT hook motif DNA-binding family protein [Trifolium medium]